MESSFNLQLLDSMNEQFPSHLHLYRQGFAKYCLDIINNINDSGISSSIDPVCLSVWDNLSVVILDIVLQFSKH